MHTATSSPHVIKSFRQLNSDLHVFFVFPVLLLSAFLRCLVHIISAGRKRSNVVMWVECHGVFERQLRFHHVSLRVVIHTYVHTRDQYQYPLNLTVAYFEPPALIAYLKVRRADATFTLEPIACSAIERWKMEISVSEEDTVTSLVQGTDLFKNNVSFWATGTTESLRPQAKNRSKAWWSYECFMWFSLKLFQIMCTSDWIWFKKYILLRQMSL